MSLVPSEQTRTFRIPVNVEVDPVPPEPLSVVEELVRKFKIAKESGIYPYINSIKPIDLLIYLIILQAIMLFFSKIPLKLNHVFGFGIGMALIYVLHERHRTQFLDEMSLLEIKMESIVPKPHFFYMDANIIEIMYNLLEFYDLSPKNYEIIVYSIDELLKLRLDFEKGVDNCGRQFPVARQHYDRAINGIIGLELSVPTDNIRLKKLKLGRETLQLYLMRHLDFMKDICNKQLEEDVWDVQTTPITDMPRDAYQSDNLMNILF